MTDPISLLQIEESSASPAYRQIADGLRTLLVAGQFQALGRLPTVRQLASRLGVHHNTVAQAYRVLAKEGWLDLKRRRGAALVDRPDQAPAPAAGKAFSRRLRDLVAKAVADGLEVPKVARELQSLGAALLADASRQ